MRNLEPLLNRLATFAVGIAQSIVSSFGGGNGDPTLLHEPAESSDTPRPEENPAA
jgi:hypothetical protein